MPHRYLLWTVPLLLLLMMGGERGSEPIRAYADKSNNSRASVRTTARCRLLHSTFVYLFSVMNIQASGPNDIR